MSTQLLSVEDVAKELNLSEDTIRSYIRSRKLPAIKFGNTYRISREDLDAFINQRRTDRKNEEK